MIESIKGKILKSAKVSDDEIILAMTDGSRYKMYHEDDCCEIVTIESMDGDLKELIGERVISIDERTNRDDPPADHDTGETFTWTFYTINTVKDAITIRWFGTSNGHYSEEVSFIELD